MSDLLQRIRVRRSLYFRPTFGAPWGSRLEGIVTHFHYVVEGTCSVHVDGTSGPTRLSSGDLVVVPRGRAHLMSDPQGTRATDFFKLVKAHNPDRSGVFRAGGTGSVTKLLCGGMELENGSANVLLAALPPLILVRGHAGSAPPWLQATAIHLLDELQSRKAYRETVVARLADVLFIQAIRAYLDESAELLQTGLLAALRDRRIGQALALMHAQPEERWTVAALATRLAISRSAFAEKFSRLLGESPHRYLARHRLNIASELLRTTEDKISSIAASAGYRSLPSFSRAFKQQLGMSPVVYRRRRHGTERR